MALEAISRPQFQSHPFHMVDPSPWPIVTSHAVLSMLVSFVLWFNHVEHGLTLVTLSLLSVGGAFTLWWRDVTVESTYLGDHTLIVQKGLSIGVILFIVTEAFVFVSVFWAYFHSSLAPTVELGSVWPPTGIETLNPFAIPLINTVLLLSSGATVTYSHHALIGGDRYGTLLGLGLTIILALVFTALQGIEYVNAPFTMADGIYGTCFFASTGLHGIHIIVGTIFLTVAFFRIYAYHLTTSHHVGYEAAILYWHFVDVVWLILYLAVYIWGADTL